MGWNPYGLDQVAHRLVREAIAIDENGGIAGNPCLREAYEMQQTVAYGLERFWGEALRHKGKQEKNAAYWTATWRELVKIMSQAGVTLPNDNLPSVMSQKLWGDLALDGSPNGVKLSHEHRQLALAVLAQLCDCMVWWTQRYKK
jgi:hypothetical protein